MPKRFFEDADFLAAARDLAAAGGPASVTVTSVSERLGAPVGSFYHRFASRDVLNCCSTSGCALAKGPEQQHSSFFGSTISVKMQQSRGPPLCDCSELPHDGVKSGFNHFVYNDGRRNALAQIRADRRFRRIGQYEARESKLVGTHPAERIARKALVGGID